MMQRMHLPAFGATRRFLGLAFLLMIVMFGVTNTVALVEIHRAQASNREVVQNGMRSVEYIARYVHAVDQERLLVEAHIFGADKADHARVEQKIDALEQELDQIASEYDPLTTFQGERPLWERLQHDLARVRGPVEQAIALSRQNRDDEARAVIVAAEPMYTAIDRDGAGLININNAAAELAVERVHVSQRRSVLFLGGVTLVGMSLAFLVAAWVTRLMSERDAELRQSAEALAARNRELDAFAGRVAHDLRGPLTTVSLSAEQLVRRVGAQDGAAAVLRRGVRRMEGLIHDLLALSRIDVQQPGVRARLDEVAAMVAQDLAGELGEVGGRLVLEVGVGEVACSAGLLRQALWNLCENAIKYRRLDAGLELELRGRAVGRRYELSVTDNGAGMSAHEARHVFEPFFRAAAVQHMPGTGLGLSIVKRIVESCGGAITMESTLGRGTTFSLNFPLADERREPARSSV